MKINLNYTGFHGFFLFFFSVLFLGLFPSVCFAESDFILERAFFIDHSHALTIQTIQTKTFTPYYSQITNQGFIDDPLWIRLTLKKPIENHWVLRLLPTYIDSLEVYQQVNHQWKLTKVGDRYAHNKAEYPVTAFAVSIDPNGNQSDIYIKINTTSTTLISTEVMTEHELYHTENLRDILLSAYLGIVLMTLIYSISLYYRFRESVIKYFCFLIAAEIIFVIFIVGLGGHYLLPQSGILTDKITSFFVFMLVLFGLLFHRVFIQCEVKNQFLVNLMSVLIVFECGLVVLYFVGFEHLALKLNVITVFGLAVVLCKIPIDYIIKKKKTYSLSVAIVYAVVGPGVSFGLTPFLGLNTSTFWSLYSNLFNGFFTSILLLKLIYDRNKSIENKLNRLAIDNEKEKWANDQQKKLLSMLVHEIKVPLSVLKLAVDHQLKGSEVGGHASRAIYSINDLINRFMEFDRLDSSTIVLNKTQVNLHQMIEEVIQELGRQNRFNQLPQLSLMVYSDAAILKVILQNLISNALKYALVDSIITITTEQINNEINFTIINEIGDAGAPDSQLVFKKYYRNPQASRISGTGLGLYLVYSFIELLGGRIHYENKNNKVKFELWIPV
jgi:signal transduction histidine kinase